LNSIYLYLILALSLSVLIYFVPFKRKKHQESNTLFTEALNAMVRGDKGKAVNLLKQVVKQNSDHVQAYLQLGNIIRDDNPDQAAKIHQSLTVRPNLTNEIRVDIHRALANDFYNINQYEKSKTEAKQILLLEKRNLWALNFLITLAEKNQDWDEAANWTKQMHRVTGNKKNEDVAKFDVYKGLDCLKNGKLDEAKYFFKTAIKLSPAYSMSYRYLGDVYEKTRDLVKAVENWEIFAGKDLENGKRVYGNIESALFDLGRYSEVENFYKRLLNINPSNFDAVIRLANVLEEKGESGAAMTLVENTIISNNKDVRSELMKLKLNLTKSTPIELGHQIDDIIETLSK